MDEILNKSINEMAGLSFDCSCGRRHTVGIRKIVIGTGVMNDIAAAVKEFSNGKVFFIADSNTYKVYGKKVEERLLSEKTDLKSFVFQTDHPLVPDEKALGRLLIEMEADTSLIVTVGSGTLNDLTRMISCKTKVPYMIVATAPSMDGYASVVSPLIVEKYKRTFDGVYPIAIFGDIDIIKDAPMHMLYAGFGDVLGKLTAKSDWDLTMGLHKEDYYCETSMTLVKQALKKCIDNIEGIVGREPDAVRYVMEGLVLAGITIGLVGNSRPASGAEHHIAHYWEIDAVSKDQEHALHGNCVGVGTVVTAMIYEMMQDKLPFKVEAPSSEYVTGLLTRLGAAKTPAELGVAKEVFRQSVLGAKDVRTRFSILHVAHEMGLLEEFSRVLTRRFYD